MAKLSLGRGGPGTDSGRMGGGDHSRSYSRGASSNPGAPCDGTDEWVDRLAILLDRAIPLGDRFGIGLDAIIGLIPGLGDVASSVLSAVIIVQAHRAGVPKPMLMRMVANVGIDTLLGSVPVIGDLFDVAFQSNLRNAELYRQSVRGKHDSRRDTGFLILLLIGLGVLAAVPILVLVWLFRSVKFF